MPLDRSAAIHLASKLPKGDKRRRDLLAHVRQGAVQEPFDARLMDRAAAKLGRKINEKKLVDFLLNHSNFELAAHDVKQKGARAINVWAKNIRTGLEASRFVEKLRDGPEEYWGRARVRSPALFAKDVAEMIYEEVTGEVAPAEEFNWDSAAVKAESLLRAVKGKNIRSAMRLLERLQEIFEG